MKKKIIAIALCAALAVGGVVAGSLAWLQDSTPEVVNTFTYGDINISLAENDNGEDQDNNSNTNSYKMIPGYEIKKDPLVTVKAGSEDCLLFVKVDESDNLDDFMNYSMADGWIELDSTTYPGVYYQVVGSANEDKEFAVIKDNKLVVKDSVTKEDFNGLAENNLPKMCITAYAHQLQKSTGGNSQFTASEAWENIQKDLNN